MSRPENLGDAESDAETKAFLTCPAVGHDVALLNGGLNSPASSAPPASP